MLTIGLSLLATGVKDGKAGTEMIPVKALTAVRTKRDGILNSVVEVIAAGATIGFRVSHNDAAAVATVLN